MFASGLFYLFIFLRDEEDFYPMERAHEDDGERKKGKGKGMEPQVEEPALEKKGSHHLLRGEMKIN